MADKIVISVEDLFSLANELHNNGEDIVELTILDAEEQPDGDIIPTSLWVSAHKKSEPDWWTDYNDIEEVTDYK